MRSVLLIGGVLVACQSSASPKAEEPGATTITADAQYGRWIRTRDSSEMTDSVAYLATLPADTLAGMRLSCYRGELFLAIATLDTLLADELDPDWKEATVTSRLDQHPAVSTKWRVYENLQSLSPPDSVRAEWISRALSQGTVLKVEYPLRRGSQRVIRLELAGVGPTIAWMRPSCEAHRAAVLSRDSVVMDSLRRLP